MNYRFYSILTLTMLSLMLCILRKKLSFRGSDFSCTLYWLYMYRRCLIYGHVSARLGEVVSFRGVFEWCTLGGTCKLLWAWIPWLLFENMTKFFRYSPLKFFFRSFFLSPSLSLYFNKILKKTYKFINIKIINWTKHSLDYFSKSSSFFP